MGNLTITMDHAAGKGESCLAILDCSANIIHVSRTRQKTAEHLAFALESLAAEKAARAELTMAIAAAQRLCEIYFTVACEAMGEAEVRAKRDAIIAKAAKAVNAARPARKRARPHAG